MSDEDDEVELRCPKDRVIIEPDPFPETMHGLILPSEFAERPEYQKWYGTVREVGPGEIDPETGRRIPPDVEPGDRVMYDRIDCEPLDGFPELTSVHADAILLKGEDVTRFSHTPKSGIKADGSRANPDNDKIPEPFR